MTRFAGAPQVQDFLADRMDFGQLGADNIMQRGRESADLFMHNSRTARFGLDAMEKIRQQEFQNEIIDAQAQSQASQMTSNAWSGAVGSIAGGLGKIDFGGGGGGGGYAPGGGGSFSAPAPTTGIDFGSIW